MLPLLVNGIHAPSLVGTGAAMSLLPGNVRRWIKKVVTSPDCVMFRGANNATIEEICLWGTTAYESVTLLITFYFMLFVLVYMILYSHSVLIDREQRRVDLGISNGFEPPGPIVLRVYAADTRCCTPRTAMYLQLCSIPATIGGEYLPSSKPTIPL